MIVKSLTNSTIDEVIACFLLAFENYYVAMPMYREYYVSRWRDTRVDFTYSYGMYDDDQLVGFVLHSIDYRSNSTVAYNAGTGVIPSHRGRKIVQEIYTNALPDLANKGIDKSTLEVITLNEAAIKAYTKIGFKITRKLLCFKGELPTDIAYIAKLEPRDLKTIEWNTLPHQEYYAWEHQRDSLLVGDYQFYYVMHGGKAESFFIHHITTDAIVQMDVLHTSSKNWERLTKGICQVCCSVSIINIDERLHDKIDHLYASGLIHFLDQYEMKMDISPKIV